MLHQTLFGAEILEKSFNFSAGINRGERSRTVTPAVYDCGHGRVELASFARISCVFLPRL